MESAEYVSDNEIESALKEWRWTIPVGDGRLMLAELLLKAGAGYRNSHTEEGFMGCFKLLNRDRTPNKRGRQFLCSMMYKHSNSRPDCYELMTEYRQ